MFAFSIVIPAYNEENGIKLITERLLGIKKELLNLFKECDDVEIIIVDDGSSDKTAQIVESYHSVKLIKHLTNKGYGAALKTGFAAARGDYLAFLDADATYPPEALVDMLRELVHGNADMVVASRMQGTPTKMPVLRYIGNKFYALCLSWLSNRKITDAASGMRVFKKSILARLYPLSDGLDFTPGMSTRALSEGLAIIEIPILYEERIGRSKLNVVKDGFVFLASIVKIARLYNPLKFFGLFGALILFFCLMLGVKPVAYYVTHRSVPDYFVYRLFTILVLSVVAVNSITFGILSNYVLTLMNRKEPGENTFVAKYNWMIKKFGIMGIALIVSAFILNRRTLLEYLFTFHIHMHWSYILTGAFLFLVGFEMLMTSVLITIMDELYEKQRSGE